MSVTLHHHHHHHHAPLRTLFPRPPYVILSASKRVSYQTQCCHLVCQDVFDAQIFLLQLNRRGTCGRPPMNSGISSDTVDRFWLYLACNCNIHLKTDIRIWGHIFISEWVTAATDIKTDRHISTHRHTYTTFRELHVPLLSDTYFNNQWQSRLLLVGSISVSEPRISATKPLDGRPSA